MNDVHSGFISKLWFEKIFIFNDTLSSFAYMELLLPNVEMHIPSVRTCFNPIYPGYFCLIMLPSPPSTQCPCIKTDRKTLLTWNLAQSYFVMLQKKWWKKFSKLHLLGWWRSNYVNFFEKLCKKQLNYVFFLKINIVAARTNIFKIFFQFLKVKIR